MIRAAFIGIDRHSDPLVRDLNGAVRDATALWAVLSDSIDGMAAALITNEHATLATVTRALDETLGTATEDDVVLLSFAGHGTPDHRLVLTDTRADDLPGTTLDMADLARRFRESRARAVLLLLDCCFSGGATARVLDLGVAPRAVGLPLAAVAGQGRVLFAASAADEPALEDPQTRHGLFTKAILDTLLLSTEPIGVLGLAEEVVGLVRASAARFGYQQTPAIFGHVQGELSLPPGQRGATYYAAFPDLAPVRTSGRFAELAGYGLPDAVLDSWSARYPDGLNTLQMEAVNEHNILGGSSLLVVAPTSAGKTFVGEMAALRAVAEGRKAVFLLPYKALVNEKYEDFSAYYGEELSLRIVRCSGDWQDQVGDVLRGKYDIAFFTYEKFLSLSLAAPHLLHQIGLVVLDEAQFITEPGRGMVVELLLTSLLSARSRGVAPQLVALSAVIGDANGFERWLDCGLLMTTVRPVPLAEGVIDRTGVWQYLTPDGGVNREQMLDRHQIRQRGARPSSQDVVVPLVRHLVGLGEKVIVFRNMRGSASGCALYLSRELGLPRAATVIDALPDGDRSAMSGNLRTALEGGVAFHNGDLTRDERIAVEHGFRRMDGGVQVLVATSTVAAGVNTPASTVVIVETAFPGAGKPQPYTVAQYKNMAGRAGRLGYEAQGKTIVIGETPFERERLFRRYAEGAPESVQSSFDERAPGTWVMKLMAQVREVPRNAVVDLVANTYGGFLAILRDPEWRARMAARLDHLLDRMIAEGLIDAEGEGLRLTMLGQACGESPLELESALRLVELIRALPEGRADPETLLHLIEALPERDADYTPQNRHGEAVWGQRLAGRLGADLARLLRRGAGKDRLYYARCKRALIVSDWIDGVPTSQIEDSYSTNPFSRIGHGDIRGYADGSRFLLDVAVRIAAIVLDGWDGELAVDELIKRLELGIPAELLPLLALPVILTRGELLQMRQAGLMRLEEIGSQSEAVLRGLLGERGRTLFRRLHPDVVPAT